MLGEVTPDSTRRIFQSLLDQAAQAGRGLLVRAIAAARLSMQQEAARLDNESAFEQLQLQVRLLAQHAPVMAERFVTLLQARFKLHTDSECCVDDRSSPSIHLEQLEQMDELELRERVETARALQKMQRLVEVPLAHLTARLGDLFGLDQLTSDHNVLRPESFVQELLSLMKDLRVPAEVRLIWLAPMSQSLGEGLAGLYPKWAAGLQVRRVLTAESSPLPPEPFSDFRGTRADGLPEDAVRRDWTPAYRETVLTLDRLRQLMTGQLEALAAEPAPMSDGVLLPYKGVKSAFENTVPAALDALQEMHQLDELTQRMHQTPDPGAIVAPETALREHMILQASSMGQVLSLEVVSLMLDRLAGDTRLLAPVRSVLHRLEPALLRLVLVDPRFFMDKQHPARRLLQEVSQKGMAFCSVDDPDYKVYIRSLHRHLGPLTNGVIQSSEPFQSALTGLLSEWDDPAAQAAIASQIQSVVAVLSYAEKRNALAEQMSNRLKGIPAVHKIPPAVLDFLTGPWSVVMAEAELKDRTGADDPGGYKGLVSELLWSAQPDLTRRDIDRLTKMVARLLSGLREGLRLIGYPSIKTSAFFDVLMKLHQQAFRSGPLEAQESAPAGLAASLLGSQEHWVGPVEAKVSGFMVFPDEVPPQSPATMPLRPTRVLPLSSTIGALDVGAWIEMQSKTATQRLQLSWVSPQGTMYLFTSARGKTQSMSRKLLERLFSEGQLQVVSGRSTVLDGALDEVVHSALLNSLDVIV